MSIGDKKKNEIKLFLMLKKNKIIINKNFKYCFFTRNGGVSKKNFSSLNCAYNKGDDEKNVKINREYVNKKFCSNKKLILLNQVHSNKVFFIDSPENQMLHGDGIISNRKDLILGVLTADCAPIVILGKKYFGIIHAGWKGAFSGIVENAINLFFKKGECQEDIFIDVGPHLKKDSFEVKKDFLINFKKLEIKSDKYISSIKKNLYFNFSLFISDKIMGCGVNNFNISPVDTYQNFNDFYSFRYYCKKGIKNCGRQISLVSIKDNNEIGFG